MVPEPLARPGFAPALLAALPSPAAADEQATKPPGILDFHATARAAAASPVDENEVVVLCQEAPAG
jgi:hypothetical protein